MIGEKHSSAISEHQEPKLQQISTCIQTRSLINGVLLQMVLLGL